ncbi:valine dehydrogenase [Nocardioides gansuensis]|uniref:Valine dehydrogenase n=1 Tax=Nocardioides gansuensis TaxID=2138300 RepID=A0A2T8FE67_9ACTN|nr:Glu/Leu/Phe/Val dehydrogenase dimerization domain-containing protein [Nocardioides gansuensis]PVG84016.1 valine dehydrogenase [Nocardioides gansuensis]
MAHLPSTLEVVDIPTVAHERVVRCRDEATRLHALIAVHSTVLGPALGGTRFKSYASEPEALKDVLRLSEGMTYKAAAAGLPLGGGKAVIVGDPDDLKTPELLAAYGRFVEHLQGLYVTAADVGTTAQDLDIVYSQTRHVVGRTGATGGWGDSGFSTALGVFEAMRGAAELLWGVEGLRGRRVGVEGVGKVGRHLVDLLLAEGVNVAVADPSKAALHQLVANQGDRVQILPSVLHANVDVYAPCALGATLDHESVDRLRARLVCGAANNQLATPDVDAALLSRDVLWVPDYVANAGGLIQVGGEYLGRTPDGVHNDVVRVGETARQVLMAALEHRIGTGAAATALVSKRLHRGDSTS